MSAAEKLTGQYIHVVPTFTLENGAQLQHVPVAYKTWGHLNHRRDNVMIICHAFTGSADVEDWWGPLMGHGRSFDTDRFFIFCANTLGSPYGTASPVTTNPVTLQPYGPEFPQTSIRDDVRLHKLVLDHLGVNEVAVVIGGSMGGMAVLEWPLCTSPGFVHRMIPIATSARHSAWCISWGETQRQCIFSDPAYCKGYYTAQPSSGLAAARMTALLTYRSRDSFEKRFGRRPQVFSAPEPALPLSTADLASAVHNEGHHDISRPSPRNPSIADASLPSEDRHNRSPPPPIFSAQSYLRYQGAKFVARFDANCYIHITRKLDTHDLARGRTLPDGGPGQSDALATVLSTLPPRPLVISIETDGLFTPNEQQELAAHIPEAELVVIPSADGHDGFLLEFEQINGHILKYLKTEFPEYYVTGIDGVVEGDFTIKKTSLFGEAEVDLTRW